MEKEMVQQIMRAPHQVGFQKVPVPAVLPGQHVSHTNAEWALCPARAVEKMRTLQITVLALARSAYEKWQS